MKVHVDATKPVNLLAAARLLHVWLFLYPYTASRFRVIKHGTNQPFPLESDLHTFSYLQLVYQTNKVSNSLDPLVQ